MFEKMTPYTFQQNSVAEGNNSVLMDKPRAMMHAMMVPFKFLAEAVGTAFLLRNVTPSFVIQ